MVRIKLINSLSSETVGEFDYAEIPQVGSQVMVNAHDWEIWGVVGVRYWPAHNIVNENESTAAVWIYAEYGGELED